MRVAAAATLLGLSAFPVFAQQPPMCFPPPDLIAMLEKEHGEQPVGAGVVGSGQSMFVLFTSRNGETWTMAAYTARGLCIIADGKDWEATPFKPRARGT
jgi:hypothetical protein